MCNEKWMMILSSGIHIYMHQIHRQNAQTKQNVHTYCSILIQDIFFPQRGPLSLSSFSYSYSIAINNVTLIPFFFYSDPILFIPSYPFNKKIMKLSLAFVAALAAAAGVDAGVHK